jgi:hypothetical protein
MPSAFTPFVVVGVAGPEGDSLIEELELPATLGRLGTVALGTEYKLTSEGVTSDRRSAFRSASCADSRAEVSKL